MVERLAAIGGFGHGKIQRFQNVPRNLADHLAVIDDQTRFHQSGLPAAHALRMNVWPIGKQQLNGAKRLSNFGCTASGQAARRMAGLTM